MYNVAGEHIAQPLKNFKMTLPEEWGMPLGWSLTFVPILIIIAGLLFHMIWKSRGIPFRMVSLLYWPVDSSAYFNHVHVPLNFHPIEWNLNRN